MKKKILRHHIFKNPSSRIICRYCIIAVIIFIICTFLVPILLNYPPESINTPFDIQMSYISYYQQFGLACFATTLLIFMITKILLKDIDKWYKLDNEKKYDNIELITKIRKKCFNLPYLIFLFEIFLPVVGIGSILLLTGSHEIIMIVKILIIALTFSSIVSVSSYIFSKDLYSEILSDTYKETSSLGFRITLGSKIVMQILPICISILLFTSLIGYSLSIKEKEDIYFKIYHNDLIDQFDVNKIYTENEIISILNNLPTYENQHSKFIINPNKNVTTLSGTPPSNFIIEYTLQLASKYNGRTYGSYGVDIQGATISLNSASGIYVIGILYTISSASTLNFLMYNFIFLLSLVIATLYFFTRSLSKDLNVISNGLNNIYENKTIANKLPVVSNDEIGDLVTGFNNIQQLNTEHVEQIKENQDLLMERERLASLGQLIGGIAHNLKTPIMSIAGAAEGLHDLTTEYNKSIGDPEVTNEDHHCIANEMNQWIEKIKTHTSYMSDIITAVKGQAVVLSEEDEDTFDIDELIKRVTILMKHELKNALIELNIHLEVNDKLIITGNVNSLVQVINNMISNAIQSYNGTTNKTIDLTISSEEDKLIISIQDYGCGMEKNVKDKLFKEMITTKGKNGTGLGLFMSYSTIRAHFNGNITFESEKDKGTIFHIILPL